MRRLTLYAVISLLVSGCAMQSLQPLAPEGVAPIKPAQTPSRPAAPGLKPSGYFWARHCEVERHVQETLKLSTPMPEACSMGGR